MRLTVDEQGRVALPEELRERLGILPGNEVDVDVVDDHLELTAAPMPMHLEERDGRLVAVPERPVPTITTEQVRDVLERLRR